MDLDTFRTEGTTISPVVHSITHIREKSMLNFTVCASLPRAGARREKTQPFNWIHSHRVIHHKVAGLPPDESIRTPYL